MVSVSKTFEEDGRVWFRCALDSEDMLALNKACASDQLHGSRINWDSAQASIISKITNLHNLVASVLPGAKPVRALVFDKTPAVNWGVAWHQDRVIAVKEKHDVEGYKNWTKKSGVWHVEPPVDILAKMVFARIHFGENTLKNGCMEIALASHKYGYIKPATITEIVASAQKEMCVAQKGDVLILKALTLHRSRKSNADNMRKVLRVDYSNQNLPKPLQWAELV